MLEPNKEDMKIFKPLIDQFRKTFSLDAHSDEQIVKRFQKKTTGTGARGKAKNPDVVHERIILDSQDNDESKESN